MRAEDVEKYTANKRTVARTINNNVPVVNYRGDNQIMEMSMSAIENLASKHEKFSIDNAKTGITIATAKLEQEFQAKYLNDPTVYTNQEKFENMLKAYKELDGEKNKVIRDSKYLDNLEKEKFVASQNIASGEKLNNIQYKRNQMFIKETYDTAILNRTQLEEIGSNLDPSDTERFNEVLTGLERTGKSLEKTGMSRDKISAMLGESIANIEYSRDNKEVLAIVNSNKSFDEKFKAIESYKKASADKNYIDAMTNKYGDSLKLNEEERKAFKQSFLVKGSQVSSGQDKELSFVERKLNSDYQNYIDEQKRAARERKSALDEQKRKEVAIRNAQLENDPYKYVESKYDAVPSTQEFVSDNYLLKETYGATVSELGDPRNRDIVNIVSKADMSNLQQQVYMNSQAGRTDEEIIKNVLIPYADDVSGGDSYKKNIILKNIGANIKGYSPVLLLEGGKRPSLIKNNATYLVGQKASKEIKMETPTWLDDKMTRDNARTRYRELSNSVGATVESKSKLNTFIVGKMKEMGYKDFTPVDVETFLEENENYTEVKNSIQDLKDTHIYPVNYRVKTVLTSPTKKQQVQTQDDSFFDEPKTDTGFTQIKRKK